MRSTFAFFFSSFALVACSSGNGDTGPSGTDDAGNDAPALETAADSSPLDAGNDASTITDSGLDAGFVPAAQPPYPKIGAGDGALLSPLKVVSIFAQGEALATTLTKFADALPSSEWYSTMRAQYGLGAATNVDVTGPAMGAQISYSQLVQYIRALIQGGQAPAPDGNTMYMVYLPNGTTYSDSEGLNTNCQYSEGAHFQYGTGNDNWAYAQRCFGNGQSGIDDVTNTAAHEIIEAATDPTGNGWGLPAPPGRPYNGDVWRNLDFGYITEVADLCDGAIWNEGGFAYARTWANPSVQIAGGDPCVPAITDPYYSVSTTVGWQAIPAGSSVDVTLTGWSTAPTNDWAIEADEYDATNSGEFTATLTAARTKTISGTVYPILNNGETVTLHVTVPASAKSGDWVTFGLYSEPITSPATDLYHLWPIGFYVP